MKRNLQVLIVVAAVVAAPASARADSDREFYGHELLIGDGVGWLLAVAGIKADSGKVIVAGLVVVATGAPVVHLLHDDPGRAAVSFVLRAGLPLAGVAIGGAMCPSRRGEMFACVGAALVGGVIGYLAALTIDVAVLGFKDKETVTQPRMFTLGARF